MDFVNQIADWQFLQEPLYRWVIFLIAIHFILYALNGVAGLIKE